MDALFALAPPNILLACFAVAFFAGVVKGMVGFALPLILISGLSSLVEPKLALAGLILPTVLLNLWQGFRQGIGPALHSLKSFRIFIIVGGVMLAISAQMVRVISPGAMFILIGVPVTFFTALQLLGWRPHLRPDQKPLAEGIVGAIAGAMGGFSGTWGPPTVLFLTALDTPKLDQVRIQGVLYALGSLVLLVAHIGSGVLRSETMPFAFVMLPTAILGMALGLQLQDRIDQRAFQRATLVVLFLAGLNLIRKGLMG
ncbi:sulfite exporter TauE/SafE family protein [Rhodalgimonas zhirmunskyi]|uniref:Probable membrane transporter protein n=1 Tax=Rhodalgimonas zhirmunskyi TaxID=2964767 RepID=A0AAJ1X7S9_9RHOB|nr:sulfite exporter TauE/SafE family protein [Rhodoalgimonas zhirmunskyi]MDQ2095919.1 sulfite exporter TauE/SafE family protein [Rhodoalgimonas zhirmunskyi]